MATATNTAYLRPNFLAPRAGIHASRLFHPIEKTEKVGVLLGSRTQAVDLGGQSLTDKFVASPGSTVVWAHEDSMPQLQKVKDGEVIYSASIITLGRQRFIVRPEAVGEDGSCIVHIESGVFGEIDLATLKDTPLFPHGSFGLDPGSTLLGMQESLGDMPGFPSATGLAKRVKWRVTRDISDTLQIPWHRNDLWKILPGGQIIVQGINGESFRIICEKGSVLRRVDMSNGHAVFEEMEGKRLAARAQEKARRADAKTSVESSADTAAPAPEAAADETPSKRGGILGLFRS